MESYDGGRTRALGTGFLVGPDLVLTNFHVLEPLYGGQWSADRVRFRFDYTVLADGVVVHPGQTYGLAPDWDVDHSRYSPLDLQVDPSGAPGSDELDHALVRLDRAAGDDVVSAGQGAEPGAPARGFLELRPDPHDFLSDPLLSILQHPDGQPLKLAIDTSAVLGTVGPPDRPTRVRYATLTEPGSSGSPCFDADWNLVALHHSGDPKYEAFGRARYNEGIPAQALWALLDERDCTRLLGRPARGTPGPARPVPLPHPGPSVAGPSAASATRSSAPTRRAPERPAPLDLDPFVPRPEERLLEQALERPGAVVALHGPQGAGKSRLAREHARSSVRAAGPRSVWFVDLSGRGEQEAAARVVQHLPSSLGTDVEPEDVLAEWFADREVLVVLDNCDDAPLTTQGIVGHLLAHCSGVSVLTTSQASLGARRSADHRARPAAAAEGRHPGCRGRAVAGGAAVRRVGPTHHLRTRAGRRPGDGRRRGLRRARWPARTGADRGGPTRRAHAGRAARRGAARSRTARSAARARRQLRPLAGRRTTAVPAAVRPARAVPADHGDGGVLAGRAGGAGAVGSAGPDPPAAGRRSGRRPDGGD